jgi:hypothetical protein
MTLEARCTGSTSVRFSGAGLAIEVVVSEVARQATRVGVNPSEASEYLRR